MQLQWGQLAEIMELTLLMYPLSNSFSVVLMIYAMPLWYLVEVYCKLCCQWESSSPSFVTGVWTYPRHVSQVSLIRLLSSMAFIVGTLSKPLLVCYLTDALRIIYISILVTVGPKCMLDLIVCPNPNPDPGELWRVCWWDRQTAGQMPDHYIMLSARHGQCNNLEWTTCCTICKVPFHTCGLPIPSSAAT